MIAGRKRVRGLRENSTWKEAEMNEVVTSSPPPPAGAGGTFQCCVCGTAPYEIFLTDVPDRLGIVEKTATLVRCKICGLVALFPLPTFEETAALYPKTFWRTESKPGTSPSLAKRFETWYREHLIDADFAFVAEFLRPGLRHLDVGCSTGDFIVHCQKHGTVSSGIELSESAARHCREQRGLDVVVGDLTDTDFGDRKFDVITYNAVLEHVPNPYAHLLKCKSLLAPGGRVLILGLPNLDSVGFKLSGKHWMNLDVPRHLHQFTRDSLTFMLDKAGFIATRVDFRSPRFNPASLVASAVPSLHRHKFDAAEARTGQNPILKKTALLALLQVARPADWAFSHLGMGENMSCVAEVRSVLHRNA
jgi:2-polyprenyl-3-methyl-5-hydroxy-6-metoxy-1,4-benzoquinol methylase